MKENDLELKPILRFSETQETINTVIADMSSYSSICSHQLIDYDSNREFKTSFALDEIDYKKICHRLEQLKQNIMNIRVLAKNVYKECQEAFEIIMQVVKCRFLFNLISTSYEMLTCCAFNNVKGWNRNRYDVYDFVMNSLLYDNKVVKLLDRNIPYYYDRVTSYDKKELKRVLEILLYKDLNKNYNNNTNNNIKNCNNKEIVNRFVHLFVSKTDNAKNIMLAQANLMASYQKLKEIAKENNLDNKYTVELDANNQKIKAIVIVYEVD